MKPGKYLLAAILCVRASAHGATAVVPVTEDTSLFEISPTANLGAAMLGAGAISQINFETGLPWRERALMRFELVGIPANAIITAAQVSVTVVRVPAGSPPGSTFELHRVLKQWGEGDKGGTLGSQATDGEATWLAAMHPGVEWSGAGASGADDTDAKISSTVSINALATYTFPSTPDLVADVQSWLTNPASNFGWLMKSASENLRQSARRFGNRESGTGAPSLTVSYTVPAAELKIQQFELRPDGMFLSWAGGAPPYQVERAENILGPWTAVTTPSNETQATAPADVPTAFYRVVSLTP